MSFYITVKGKGGPFPRINVDPIPDCFSTGAGPQQVVSRNNNPHNPTVLSITAFNGGSTTNVIPNEVKLKGTFRAMDESWRFQAHQLIRRTCEELVKGLGGSVDLHIDVGYPSVYNNEALK